MKRATIFGLCCLLALVIGSPVEASQPDRGVWIVEIPASSGVSDPGFSPGNTLTGVSGFSGTTVPQVREAWGELSGTTILNISQVDYDFYTLAPYNLQALSGVTPDMSGVTYTIRMHEIYVDDETGIAQDRTRTLAYEVPFTSGETPYALHFKTMAEHVWFEFLSSCSAFEGPKWYLIGRKARAGDEETLVVFPEQHTDFGASGVSNDFMSGGSGFSLPEGATWAGFFANGDGVPFSTDDTDPSSSGRFFPDEKEMLLPRAEAINLGIGGGKSGSAGELTMTPYSRRPY